MAQSNSFHEAQVLLVDDNPRYLEELHEWLVNIFGYRQVQQARNAAEAMAKLGEKYDIIVSDQKMEKVDSGFDILEEVKKQNITSIVIILTAIDTVAYCRRACKAGAWDYISKSMEGNPFEEVHHSIQEALLFRAQWGNHKDERWFNEQLATLQQTHGGQYIAILNNDVLEFAPSEAELKQKLATLRLPSVAVVIKKVDAPFTQPLLAELTVFVEGPTDVKYIETAARWLGHKDLLKRVDLKVVGNEKGDESGGETKLTSGFEFLKHNPQFRPHKVLFLFDQDIPDGKLPLKKDDNYENLYVRRTGAYNDKKKGSEYLFDEPVFEEWFQQGFVEKDLGRATVANPTPIPKYVLKKGADKKAMCDWLCTQRKNTATDFANFEPIFQLIQQILDRP